MAKTRTPRKKAQGLGDTVETVLEATGIAKIAKFVLGEDCNCNERKKKLNELFPYRKPECLTEEEYNWLSETRILEQQTFKPSEVTKVREIYSRVMKVRLEPSSCASCFRDVVNQLKKVYEAYKAN